MSKLYSKPLAYTVLANLAGNNGNYQRVAKCASLEAAKAVARHYASLPTIPELSCIQVWTSRNRKIETCVHHEIKGGAK